MVIISALFDGGSCCDAITCPMMQRVSLSLPLFLLGVIFTTSQRMAARFMTSIPSAGGSNTFQIRILREEDFEPFRGRLMPLPADCQPARRRIINSEMWLPVLPVLFHFVWIYMHTHTHTHIYMGLFRLKYRNQLFARVRKFVKCCGFICDMTLESVPVWVLSNGSKTVPVHPSLLTPSHPVPPHPALSRPAVWFISWRDHFITCPFMPCESAGEGEEGKRWFLLIEVFHPQNICVPWRIDIIAELAELRRIQMIPRIERNEK